MAQKGGHIVKEERGALEGIRVLDFSHVWQGPLATQILADFGADVIKIERLGAGDWSRSWGPFIDGLSLPYIGLNRNKRSVAFDLKAAAAKKVVLQLVKKTDILVHNFRPGVMEKLGLGYEDLKQENPRLIYAYSSGWGDQGPYVERGKPGHDLLARAAAGWFQNLIPDKPPIPSGISADHPAGLMLAIGILLALAAREKTGVGQLVTTDLFSVAMYAHIWESAEILNKTRISGNAGTSGTEEAIDKSFRTQDGLIELSPVFTDNALRDISIAMGLGDLSLDPCFHDAKSQLAHKQELNEILARRFLEKTTAQWISILEKKGVLCGEIHTFEEAASDPQTLANHMVVEMEHPRIGGVRLLGMPIRLHGTPSSLRVPPGYLGEHSQEVLAELGYSAEEIAEMVKQGVVEISAEPGLSHPDK
jgi:crotonobetainyl-CoA:carnitine CoA-transferase CaiB-like acyl-CoA transferase